MSIVADVADAPRLADRAHDTGGDDDEQRPARQAGERPDLIDRHRGTVASALQHQREERHEAADPDADREEVHELRELRR